MGIQGLLPFLKKIHQPVNVSQFAGCTVAIDAYCWLHKGAFSCAEKLALGEKTEQYVYYCMKFINYLLSKNIKPIMVFDGCHLPSKKNVETSRREKRDLNRKKAAQLLREGKRAEARECLQRSIDISPQMALNVMNACREKGVDCIVAPYEADSQLAYLNKIGVAQLIITEDSDLLLFGCEKVLFKMDHSGNGILIEQSHLNQVMDIQTGHFTFEKFRYMCILSGCDYLASLTGIGLVKANKVFKVARQADIKQLLKKLSTYLKMNLSVSDEYIDGFIAADNTFLYPLVYDPLKREMVPLNPYPPGVNPEEMKYAGSYVPGHKALQIALGNINIYTGEKFADFNPEHFVPKYVKKKPDMLHLLSMWDRNYRTKPKTVLHEAQQGDRPTLKGREIKVKSSLKKKSPHKRPREVEDSRDVCSNTELSDLYKHSPVKKKLRHTEVDDDLQRFMLAAKTEPDSESEEEEDTAPVRKVSLRSPRFFNSLTQAHPDTGEPGGPGDTEGDKENGAQTILSPRNVFANKSPSKKPKFSLNATKPPTVKSRFFASSTKPSSSPLITEHVTTKSNFNSASGYRPIHSNTANVYNNTKSPDEQMETSSPIIGGDQSHEQSCDQDVMDKTPDLTRKSFSFSKLQSSDSQKSSQSPSSAFSWSKFKFARQASTDSVHSNSQGSNSSKGANKQFKKVVSETKLDSFIKQQDKTQNDGSSTDNACMLSKCASDSKESINSGNADDVLTQTPSASLGSLPYSIDSDCLTQSDFIERDDDATSQEQKQTCAYDDKDISIEPNESQPEQKKKGLSIYFKPKSVQNTEDTIKNAIEEAVSVDNSDSKHVSEPVVFTIHSDDEELDSLRIPQPDIRVRSSLHIPKPDIRTKITNATAIKTVQAKSKPGCRVSGLSRKSKKSSTSTDSNKQHNLKDMFSKFAHNKSNQSKLSHDQSKPVDLTDEIVTPEGNNSLIRKQHDLKKNLIF